MRAGAKATSCRQQSLFERLGEVERLIAPNVGDWRWWIYKKRATVCRLRDPRANELLGEVGREKCQSRFILVLGIPRCPPRIIARVSRRIEEHHDRVELAGARRQHLHIDFLLVPMPQRVADVDA